MNTDNKPMAIWTGCVWALLLLGSASAQAQVVREDSTLVDTPDGKAVVFNVKAGTSAKAVKRQGFWVQIEVGGKTGWIKASGLSFSGGAGGLARVPIHTAAYPPDFFDQRRHRCSRESSPTHRPSASSWAGCRARCSGRYKECSKEEG